MLPGCPGLLWHVFYLRKWIIQLTAIRTYLPSGPGALLCSELTNIIFPRICFNIGLNLENLNAVTKLLPANYSTMRWTSMLATVQRNLSIKMRIASYKVKGHAQKELFAFHKEHFDEYGNEAIARHGVLAQSLDIHDFHCVLVPFGH